MLLQDMPYLLTAVQELCRCNNMSCANLRGLQIPEAWEQRAEYANNTAADLDGRPLKDFIPQDQIDSDLAAPDDLAIDVLVDGEESVKNLLVMYANAQHLDIVLESFFDGELQELLS